MHLGRYSLGLLAVSFSIFTLGARTFAADKVKPQGKKPPKVQTITDETLKQLDEARRQESHEHPLHQPLKHFQFPNECHEKQTWSFEQSLCLALPEEKSTDYVYSVHGNAFFVGIQQSGTRGRDDWASPNHVSANLGHTVGEFHFLNVNTMLTAERWTFPGSGYPHVLQMGETKDNHRPYIDAQHPHSSPIMGLTLSDTIRLDWSSDDTLRVFFAPRGASTDGPIAFMHRPTAILNPDVPLGHHIGQDSGHISSTVLGAALTSQELSLELSAFNGAEPHPSEIDLPMDVPNSLAARLSYTFGESFVASGSFAYVDEPHPHPHTASPALALVSGYDPYEHVTKMNRLSLSGYHQWIVSDTLTIYNTLIFGNLRTFGLNASKNSVTHELLLRSLPHHVWTRAEWLERAPAELGIRNLPDPYRDRRVGAFTLGYTYMIYDFGPVQFAGGVSGTKSFLNGEMISSYGENPWTGKAFIQLSGGGHGLL